MLRVIDTRPILGNGGEIALVDSGIRPDDYVIEVSDCDGSVIATIEATNKAEALDAYRHPFARSHVPNIFKRIPDLEAFEIEDEDTEEVPV
jgi:hypothetical protein